MFVGSSCGQKNENCWLVTCPHQGTYWISAFPFFTAYAHFRWDMNNGREADSPQNHAMVKFWGRMSFSDFCHISTSRLVSIALCLQDLEFLISSRRASRLIRIGCRFRWIIVHAELGFCDERSTIISMPSSKGTEVHCPNNFKAGSMINDSDETDHRNRNQNFLVRCYCSLVAKWILILESLELTRNKAIEGEILPVVAAWKTQISLSIVPGLWDISLVDASRRFYYGRYYIRSSVFLMWSSVKNKTRHGGQKAINNSGSQASSVSGFLHSPKHGV